jgi:hypothetical protein
VLKIHPKEGTTLEEEKVKNEVVTLIGRNKQRSR